MVATNRYSEIVANSISAMLAYWDQDQICRFANAAYLDWFGKSSKDMIDKMTLKELLGPLYEKNWLYFELALQGKTQVFERDIPSPDGRIRNSLATYTPVFSDGKVEGVVVHVADVTSLKKLELELIEAKKNAEALATHDYLTGLPNRILLHDRLNSTIALSARNQKKFAVSILDLDNFKRINDTYGHLAGDMVLVAIAQRSTAALREYDSISRFGGDEFVILFPEIDKLEEIEPIGKRLSESAQLPITVGDSEIRLTVSMGVAIFPEHGKTMDELLNAADIALYKAKGLGKNQIAFA